MAVAGLGLQLTDYRDEACAELFGGSGYDYLDSGERGEIDRLILRAERTLFLHPPVDPPHSWSCLCDPGLLDLWTDVAVSASVTVTGVHSAGSSTVTATAASFYETMIGKSIVITTVGTFTITGYTSSTVITVSGNATGSAKTFSIASDGTYRLPSDFESPDCSTLTFTDTSNGYLPIQLVNEKIVVDFRALYTAQSYPRYACIRWQSSDGTAAHNQELVVWPEPDDDYNVAMPYAVQPQGMSVANPYPRGGPEMADLLMSAVLAICQEAKDGKRGDRWAEFQEKCRRAAQRDRSRHHNMIAGFMRPDAGARSRPFDVKDLIGST